MQAIEIVENSKIFKQYNDRNRTYSEITFSPQKIKTRIFECTIYPFAGVETVAPWEFEKEFNIMLKTF